MALSDIDKSPLYVDSTNNRAGIGTASPSSLLHLSSGASSAQGIKIENSSGSTNGDAILQFTTPSVTTTIGIDATGTDIFKISNSSALGTSDALAIDSGGKVMIGDANLLAGGSPYLNEGITLHPGSDTVFNRDGGSVVDFSRETSDGQIVRFVKDNSVVGSIGSRNTGTSFIALSTTSNTGLTGSGAAVCPSQNGGLADNAVDFGFNTARWKDLYLSGGVYLGGAGSANKLDDYEEGTWTPTCSQATITIQTANYTKVGRLVHIQYYLTVSSATATAMIIGGLPFTNISNGWAGSVLSNGGTSTNVKIGRVYAGGNYIQMLDGTDANVLANSVGSFVVQQVTYLTNA